MFVTLSQPKESRPELLDLLLGCHDRIRSFSKMAVVVGERADVPVAEVVEVCERVDRYFREALPLHVRDEEESLLPRLRGVSEEVDRALESMHAQHLEHAPMLEALASTLVEVRADPSNSLIRARLVEVAHALTGAFESHLVLEETTIFPFMRAHLTPEVQAEIVKEIRGRRGV